MNPEPRIPRHIHDAAVDWVIRRDAGLAPAEEAECFAWQRADSRHAAALAEQEKTWQRLEFPRREGAAFPLLHALKTRARARFRRRVAAGATAIVLLVGLLQFRGNWATSGSPKTPSASVVITRPEKRVLPDGSVIEVNIGGEIAVNFTPGERAVKLIKGEAHFQVAKNPARPFVVEANGVYVRAVGTAFDVEVGTAEVNVIVTEGRVALERVAARDSLDRTTMAAGTQAAVKVAEATVPAIAAITPTQVDQRLAWRSPHLEFSGTALSEAIELMNDYAADGKHFALGDAELGGLRVSGYCRGGNTDTFVRLLQASFGIEVEYRGNAIILRRGK
jgi:transmembrane sensor